MDNSRGSGKAKGINGPQPLGTHAKAAHVKVMEGGPRVPTKVSIMIMKVGKKEAVEIREVVVDPLLPRLDVGGEVARQPLQRVDVARRADLGKEDGENRGCDTPLRAPDSAVPTTPPSNVTAAPDLGPARERAGACQAPDPRHC
eukprot:scaffold8434_cov112-Isochrysis_galbana.AAC.2